MLANHREEFVTLPNDIQLCYSSLGDPANPTIVLIAGLGLQMVYWPAALIDRLVDNGFHVLCFDNRDAGRSSRANTPHPDKFQQIMRKAPEGAYCLTNMAEDTALLLSHLNIESAHIVGMSMGGMIAQTLAIHHPEKVASLTSIFSTTGKRNVGQPSLSTIWRIMRAKAPRSEQDAVNNYSDMMRHIGDSSRPNAAESWRLYSSLAWLRNGEKADPKAVFRQIGAIIKSGNRTRKLNNVDVPSLVIHGDKDPMVHPSGGKATADAIPNATYHVLEGMRHQIDDHQSHRLARLILKHAMLAQEV